MDPNTISVITPAHITKAYSYREFQELTEKLVSQGKTTGDNQSTSLIEYTKLNVQRMRRWDKTLTLNESLQYKLQNLTQKWIWLVITEAWCPDSAQCMPVIAKMAQETPNISLRFLLRDENPDIMDQYLTNGSRSIPKLIALKADSLEELGTWGPRPAILQRMVMDFKKNPHTTKEEFNKYVQLWYTQDKAQALQQEFEVLLVEWNTKDNLIQNGDNGLLI